MRKLLIILVMTAMFASTSYAQMVAVNTDVAMDAIGAPSLGIEMTIKKRSSLNLNAAYGPNLFVGHDNKILLIQPEWRYYFSGRSMYHHYVGIVGLLADYNLYIKDKKYDGEGLGIGLSYGYALPLTKRLSLTFHTSVGYFIYKQKEYLDTDAYDTQYTNHEGYPVANAKGSLFIPLRLGISFSYLIK